jgi:hypothetical protein
MTLQSSGQIKLSEIAAEYGGSAPHALSEYHDKGNAPASGEIQIAADFYGTSDYTPSAQYWTSSSTYTIHSSETSIQYKLSGGGGGGGKNQCLNCGPIHGSNGGASTMQFKNSGGSVVHTLTAAGGNAGSMGNNNCPYYTNPPNPVNTNDFNESGYPSPPWTANSGGNWSTNGTSDGGRGGKGETNCFGGCSGQAGTGISGTISTPSGAVSITITIGGGGSPGCTSQTHPPQAGGSGAAWLLGVQS